MHLHDIFAWYSGIGRVLWFHHELGRLGYGMAKAMSLSVAQRIYQRNGMGTAVQYGMGQGFGQRAPYKGTAGKYCHWGSSFMRSKALLYQFRITDTKTNTDPGMALCLNFGVLQFTNNLYKYISRPFF